MGQIRSASSAASSAQGDKLRMSEALSQPLTFSHWRQPLSKQDPVPTSSRWSMAQRSRAHSMPAETHGCSHGGQAITAAMAAARRLTHFTAAVLVVFAAILLGAAAREFRIEGNRLLKDGEPVQIISGGIHYFRVHPYQWEDRLLRMKAMGLNTVETYVAWNVHEINPGEFTWEGRADVEKFISLAHKMSMLVVLRPGPYICAEWNFGRLPCVAGLFSGFWRWHNEAAQQ
ncbi:hypothetical protein COCSUDRAFT_57118 [Coccomyxa subellipsoidea C-169]|uniref:beta-galactosidase n=1 Tax=Coccomyxa subellipsoidea (strain C-169) TaxID=574566 RepID=I0YS38_COCSC|nr:hypothetical protein COCSUDRAFT_57118 [Coccomyxa subellipsoidea C-169]EIE21207.1 hypothetical protein COCSUDRAFT_57118 [Coccomyxa subellipsoidea C-169]|eukprot:XP_005645751.1 hypothetical protein COCSUDRAFT_57118 [Coccomyxa subellipsoidea C-169]